LKTYESFFWLTSKQVLDTEQFAKRHAEARYARARPTAQELGFAYAPAAEAVTLPITDILRRIETLEARKSVDKAAEIVSVLGGEPPPAIMVDSTVEEFCAIFTPRRRRREGA
jgi:hypothetical protein